MSQVAACSRGGNGFPSVTQQGFASRAIETFIAPNRRRMAADRQYLCARKMITLLDQIIRGSALCDLLGRMRASARPRAVTAIYHTQQGGLRTMG